MQLKQGKDNTTYIVEAMDLELPLERRLEALGLTPGTRITILNNQKRGSMTVKVPRHKICCRKADRRSYHSKGGRFP